MYSPGCIHAEIQFEFLFASKTMLAKARLTRTVASRRIASVTARFDPFSDYPTNRHACVLDCPLISFLFCKYSYVHFYLWNMRCIKFVVTLDVAKGRIEVLANFCQSSEKNKICNIQKMCKICNIHKDKKLHRMYIIDKSV